MRLGRDPNGILHLHGTFVHPGKFVACQPEEPSSVPLLLDTGATTHVAGFLWRTRPKVSSGVGISTRTAGGGVSASLGQGTLLIDFSEATGALPTDLALFGTAAAGSFPVGDVASVCAAPVEWPTAPHTGAAPGHVNIALSAPATPPPTCRQRRACTRVGEGRGYFLSAPPRPLLSASGSATVVSSPGPRPS